MFREYVLAFALVVLIVVALATNWVRAGVSDTNLSCMVGVYDKVIEGVPVRDTLTGEVINVNVNITVKVFVEGSSAKVEAAVMVEPAGSGSTTISYSMPFMDMVVETSEGKAYRWSEGKAFIMSILSKPLPIKESVSMVVNSSCITGVIVYVKPLGLKVEFGNAIGFEPTLTQTSVEPMNPLPEKKNITRIFMVIKDWPKPGNLTLLVIPMNAEAEVVPYGEEMYNYTIVCPPEVMELLTSVINDTVTITITVNENYTLQYTSHLLSILIPLCTSRNIMYYVINEKDFESIIHKLADGDITVIFTYATSDLNIYGWDTRNNISTSTVVAAAMNSETTTVPTLITTTMTYATVTTLAETRTTGESFQLQPESSVKYSDSEATTTAVLFDKGVKVMPVSYTALLLGIVAALLVGCVTFVLLRRF